MHKGDIMVFGKDNTKLRQMIIELDDSRVIIENLKIDKLQLKNEIEALKKERVSQIAECSFEINFGSINAFSIERTIVPKNSSQKYGTEHTSIGYLTGGKIQEWVFCCSRETHERLAKEFKVYKETKQLPPKVSGEQ
jgi:hypothetical protein